MKSFENPSNLVRDPKGMSYGKAAALAGGTLAIVYYLVNRRDTRAPDPNNPDVLRPERRATQQVGNNRTQQQHRKVPSTEKETADERE